MNKKWIWASFIIVGFLVPSTYQHVYQLYTDYQTVQTIRQSFADPVVLFADEACDFCQKTRDLLRAKQVDFQEVNVGRTGKMHDKKKFQQLNHRRVPLLVVGDKLIVGFLPEEIEDSLATL